MMYNWVEVLDGKLNRTRFVERYSGVPHVRREGVAEHSYYVALYAQFLYDEVNRNILPPDVDQVWPDLSKVLQGALFHDMEECMTGDMLRSVKHGSAILRESLNKAGEQLLKSVFEEVLDGQRHVTTSMARWSNAKTSTINGDIVSLADLLSVVSYAYMEEKAGSTYAYTIQEEIAEGLFVWCQNHRSAHPHYVTLRNVAEVVRNDLLERSQ